MVKLCLISESRKMKFFLCSTQNHTKVGVGLVNNFISFFVAWFFSVRAFWILTSFLLHRSQTQMRLSKQWPGFPHPNHTRNFQGSPAFHPWVQCGPGLRMCKRPLAWKMRRPQWRKSEGKYSHFDKDPETQIFKKTLLVSKGCLYFWASSAYIW